MEPKIKKPERISVERLAYWNDVSTGSEVELVNHLNMERAALTDMSVKFAAFMKVALVFCRELTRQPEYDHLCLTAVNDWILYGSQQRNEAGEFVDLLMPPMDELRDRAETNRASRVTTLQESVDQAGILLKAWLTARRGQACPVCGSSNISENAPRLIISDKHQNEKD